MDYNIEKAKDNEKNGREDMMNYRAMIAIEPGVFKHDGIGYDQITNNAKYMEHHSSLIEDTSKKIKPEFSAKGLAMPEVKPASAIYLTDWGCPLGGELGVQISGVIYKGNTGNLQEAIQNLMADFGQSTVTVEYFKGNDISGSVYLENKYIEGEPRSRKTLLESKVTENKVGLHFKISIDNNDFIETGKALQDGLAKSVSASKGIYPTGILTENETSNGFTYEGTQNIAFTPDKDAYSKSVGELANTTGLNITEITIKSTPQNIIYLTESENTITSDTMIIKYNREQTEKLHNLLKDVQKEYEKTLAERENIKTGDLNESYMYESYLNGRLLGFKNVSNEMGLGFNFRYYGDESTLPQSNADGIRASYEASMRVHDKYEDIMKGRRLDLFEARDMQEEAGKIDAYKEASDIIGLDLQNNALGLDQMDAPVEEAEI